MVGLRRLFDNPRILADDPSSRRPVARKRAFTVSHTPASLDRHVDRSRCAHRRVALSRALFDALELAAGSAAIRRRWLYL